MDNPLKILLALIEQKRELTTDLFTAYTMQTEFEYDLALIKLEFRYDDEVDWTLYELKVSIIIDELKKLDSDIIHVTQKIELCSFQLSNL